MKDNAHKTKLIYKGDVYAGSFYLFVGLCSLVGGIGVYFFTERLGLYYLSIGFSIMALYMLGKGSVMIYLYYSRYRYYKPYNSLDSSDLKEERRYTRWRVLKKKRSRRIYIYAISLGCAIAFGGLFHQEKGLIVATCIPIVVIAAVEFSVGMLTEFRLTEYLKHLHKCRTFMD